MLCSEYIDFGMCPLVSRFWEPLCAQALCEDRGRLHPAYRVQSTFTHLPLVGQLGPSGNFLCDQSLGILQAFNPGDVCQAVSLQLLWLGPEKGVGWQM